MSHTIIGSEVKLPNGEVLPLSKAVRHGNVLYLSGQVGLTSEGKLAGEDVGSQTEQTIKNIEAILKEAGAGLENVIKATVWLTRAEDFSAFNQVYAKTFASRPPARSTVVSALALPGALVEIEVTAGLAEE